MSQNLKLFKCPSCGSADLTFDTRALVVTCNRCGVRSRVIPNYRISEEKTFSSSVAGTLPLKPAHYTEEEIFSHTHDEFREIKRDINELKRRVREIEKLLKITPKVIVIEEISKEEAKGMVMQFIENYMKDHEYVYPSDVADALGLKYELVREIFDILEKEGMIKKREV